MKLEWNEFSKTYPKKEGLYLVKFKYTAGFLLAIWPYSEQRLQDMVHYLKAITIDKLVGPHIFNLQYMTGCDCEKPKSHDIESFALLVEFES